MSRDAASGIVGHATRFAIVGVVNTLVYYGLYLLGRLVMPYWAAHIVATLLAMVGSFFLNTYWTFRTRPTWRKFAIFPLTNLTNYVVQTVGVVVLVEWLALDERVAPLVAAVLGIPITFLLSRKILLQPDARDRITEVMNEPAGR